MIKYIINIKHYWNIVLIIDIDYDRYDVVESALKDIDAPIKVIDDIYNKIGYQYDSGFTFLILILELLLWVSIKLHQKKK
jgi:hypothetical protein